MKVAAAMTAVRHTTKRWTSSTGQVHGSKPMSQKYIYKLLANPVFIGKITHTRNGETAIYDGLHEPIIGRATWDLAHRHIGTQDRANLHRWTHPHLLKGKLRTGDDFAMSPTSTHRPLTKRGKTKQKCLVRYYISQKALKHGFKACPIKSMNAEHLDELIRGIVLDHLGHESLAYQPAEIRDHWIRALIDSVTIAPDKLTIRLVAEHLIMLRQHEFGESIDEPIARSVCTRRPEIEDRGRLIHLVLNIQIKKIDARRLILSPEGEDLVVSANPKPKAHIVDAIGLAYRWHDELVKTGENISALACRIGFSESRVHKVLPLTYLSPDILARALSGELSPRLTLSDLLDAASQLDWAAQRKHLGVGVESSSAPAS